MASQSLLSLTQLQPDFAAQLFHQSLTVHCRTISF